MNPVPIIIWFGIRECQYENESHFHLTGFGSSPGEPDDRSKWFSICFTRFLLSASFPVTVLRSMSQETGGDMTGDWVRKNSDDLSVEDLLTQAAGDSEDPLPVRSVSVG